MKIQALIVTLLWKHFCFSLILTERTGYLLRTFNLTGKSDLINHVSKKKKKKSLPKSAYIHPNMGFKYESLLKDYP